MHVNVYTSMPCEKGAHCICKKYRPRPAYADAQTDLGRNFLILVHIPAFQRNTLLRDSLSPARWHSTNIYLSSLGILATEPVFLIRTNRYFEIQT